MADDIENIILLHGSWVYTGTWKKGKHERTGLWRYDRNGDCFRIQLDKAIAYGLPGEQRRAIIVSGEDSPNIGKWIYQHDDHS